MASGNEVLSSLTHFSKLFQALSLNASRIVDAATAVMSIVMLSNEYGACTIALKKIMHLALAL